MSKEKTSHYYDSTPSAPTRPKEIACRFGGIDFTFETDSGVFSRNRPDFGSELLLEAFIAKRKAGLAQGLRVMDLGCGYGLVGTVVKRIFPEVAITMADINGRAVALAASNATRNLVKFADIRVSDAYANVPETFDIVLTNPPIRAGKKTVFRFYEESYEHLNVGGTLFVVIQKKQGAPSSTEWLERRFGNCTVVAKDAGYRVLMSTKRTTGTSPEEQKEQIL
jgi:16S rRNA (guanine1207-N2)-methyltransferase